MGSKDYFDVQQESVSSTIKIDEVKANTDLRIIAEQLLGAARRRQRDYWQFHAPDRSDSSPSLTVWHDGFKDFGSPDDHGDIFTFLARYQGMEFQEALEFLTNERVAYTKTTGLPHKQPRSSCLSVIRTTPQPNWQVAANNLLRHCQDVLMQPPVSIKVEQYLHAQGYNKNTVVARGLGLNLTWTRLGIKKADGKEIWLAPGIVYPWYQAGELVGLKVRTPSFRKTVDGMQVPDALADAMQHQPIDAKYIQLAGSKLSTAWYGDINDPTLPVIICEGEKDCDNLYQRIGGVANVITLGSASGRVPQALIPHLTETPWIAVVLDNDEAGRRATYKVTSQLRKSLFELNPDCEISAARIPADYNDITDWILDRGDMLGWVETVQNEMCSAKRFADWKRETATYFKQGLPNPLRQALLGLHHLADNGRQYIKDHSLAALVLDIYHEAILNDLLDSNDSLTIADLKDVAEKLGRQPTDSTIRRGVEQLVALGFWELFKNSTPYIRSYNEKQTKGVENAKNKNGRGRKAKQYRAKPLSDALGLFVQHIEQRLTEALYAAHLPADIEGAWFEGVVGQKEANRLTALIEAASVQLMDDWEDVRLETEKTLETRMLTVRKSLHLHELCAAESTPIPDEFPFTNGRDYRDAYYRALILDTVFEQRQITRADAAEQLGVNDKTLSRIRKRVGVVTEARYQLFKLKSAEKVHEQANMFAPWAKDRLFGRYLESTSGSCIRLDVGTVKDGYDPHDAWVKQQMVLGYEVYVKIQVASMERFANDEELEAIAAQDAEKAAQKADNQAAMTESRSISKKAAHMGAKKNGQRYGFPAQMQVVIPTIRAMETSPQGVTHGFVCDQLRLRLYLLRDLILADAGLRETLRKMDVVRLEGVILPSESSLNGQHYTHQLSMD